MNQNYLRLRYIMPEALARSNQHTDRLMLMASWKTLANFNCMRGVRNTPEWLTTRVEFLVLSSDQVYLLRGKHVPKPSVQNSLPLHDMRVIVAGLTRIIECQGLPVHGMCSQFPSSLDYS